MSCQTAVTNSLLKSIIIYFRNLPLKYCRILLMRISCKLRRLCMKSIKNPLRISGLLFILIFLFTLGSCDMFVNWFGTSIADRVDAFDDDLSAGSYSELYKHFHSDTVDRDSMKNDPTGYWPTTSIYPDGNIKNYSVNGDTVTGTVWNGSADLSFSMDMEKDGMDYFIRTLEISGS